MRIRDPYAKITCSSPVNENTRGSLIERNRTTAAPLVGVWLLALLAVLLTGTPARAAAGAPVGAPAKAAPGSIVTVATYNICRATGCPGPIPYARRWTAAVRTIGASGAAVVAVQEIDDYNGTYRRLVGELARHGYRPAIAPIREPRLPRNRNPIGCDPYCGSHLFYRPDQLTLMRTPNGAPVSGYQPLAGITPAGVWRSVKDRPLAYALLRTRTGTPFLATSIHLPSQNKTAGRQYQRAADVARNHAAVGIARWAQGFVTKAGVPRAARLVMGDFNSYNRKFPNGPQAQMQRLGYRNAEAALRRINPRFATINRTGLTPSGFPARPTRYRLGGPRIDCIMTYGVRALLRHEVVVHRLRDGRFDPAYRGSDHNLVRATLKL